MDTNLRVQAGTGIDLDEVDSTERQSVLVVDDDMDTVFLLKQVLRSGGYNVLGASSGQEALTKVSKHEPDLVLLDLMMPEMDGKQTLSLMREMTDVPVIIVSAKDAKEDVIGGLKDGADDYISKPFYNPEVVERVKAVLRRAGKRPELSRMVFPKIGLILDLTSQEVVIREQVVRLTPKEFSFVALLAENTPAFVSYETVGNVVWGKGSTNVRKRANYLVYLLRRKFESIIPDFELIENVDRRGYRLRTEG